MLAPHAINAQADSSEWPKTIQRHRRIFISGAGGMLGQAVYEALLETEASILPTDMHPAEDWLIHADVRDFRSLHHLVKEFRPDLILNLSALTDLEYCEMHEDDAWDTNAMGAEYLGHLANSIDATYVYISTAGIFDGRKAAFTETDSPKPLSAYGRTKLAGECFAIANVKRHYILRAGWMMGGGRKDKKFISLLYRQILAGKRDLYVVYDKQGSPTYTVDFARLMLSLLASGAPYGIYHLAASGASSRLDVARELLCLLRREDVALHPVGSGWFTDKYFAPRPSSEVLLDSKLVALGLGRARDWRRCLKEYVLAGSFHEIRL
jgi:dTDP-4-dehydrorhamnose reductase